MTNTDRGTTLPALLALVAACACGCDTGGPTLAPDPCDATMGGQGKDDKRRERDCCGESSFFQKIEA